jgi:Arm DNA-binding domain
VGLADSPAGGDEAEIQNQLAPRDPAAGGLRGEIKTSAKHVVIFGRRPSDGGSIPPASTNKPSRAIPNVGQLWGQLADLESELPHMPLTDTAIRAAKPRQKTFKLYDSGGLYLEVSPSGGKWWRWKYRFGDKEKRLSFGVYPRHWLEIGSRKARCSRQQLGAGIDPSQAPKGRKSRPSRGGDFRGYRS